MAKHELGGVTIYDGSVLQSLREMPEAHFHCVVTSPPYWMQRAYLPKDSPLKADEIGREPSPEAYVEKIVSVCDGIKRVLRDDGLFFLNVGDKYTDFPQDGLCLIPQKLMVALQQCGWTVRGEVIWAKPCPVPESITGTRWERHRIKTKASGRAGNGMQRLEETGEAIPPAKERASAQWVDCPGCKKCEATQGYVLRRGQWRCTRAHEQVIQLAKSDTYFADQWAIIDHNSYTARNWSAKGMSAGQSKAMNRAPSGNAIEGTDIEVFGANPRSVWTIAPEGTEEKHYAAYPSEIPRRCIEVATSARGCCPQCGAQFARVVKTNKRTRIRPNEYTKREGAEGAGNSCANSVAGVDAQTIGFAPTCKCGFEPVPSRVLDPFGGSGTTALTAIRMGRDCTICELSPEYVDMAARRLQTDSPLLMAIRKAETTTNRMQQYCDQTSVTCAAST